MRAAWVLVAFIEALVVALAGVLSEMLGWLLRRAWKWWRKKQKERDS